MPITVVGNNTPTAGGVGYGDGTNLAFTAAGTAGQSLVSAGAGAPTWGSPASATTATNIAGGGAGQVPYQSGAGATAFVAAGTTGQLFQSNGTSAPSWAAYPAGGDATNNLGYLNIPQNSQSAAYTLVLSDAGKHIYHPSADTTARTWTIPANASVAYPVGTAVTFINDTSAGVITISINTDTLVLAGAGTTGNRSLAANGVATAIKITSTRWIISGTGLT